MVPTVEVTPTEANSISSPRGSIRIESVDHRDDGSEHTYDDNSHVTPFSSAASVDFFGNPVFKFEPLGFTYEPGYTESDEVSAVTCNSDFSEAKFAGIRPANVPTQLITGAILDQVKMNLGTRCLSLQLVGHRLGAVFVSDSAANILLPTIQSKKIIPPVAKGCKCVRLSNKPDGAVGNFTWFGPACASMIPSVFTKSSHNEQAALIGRHLNHHDPSCLEHWRNAIAMVGKSILRDVDMVNSKVETMEQWVDAQPPNKRSRYLQELPKLDQYDFNNAKLHTRAMFIKAEIQQPPGWDENMEDKFPRGIQGLSHPVINMILGPFMKWVSKSLAYKFLNCTDSDWPVFGYTSGCTPSQIGAWYKDMKDRGLNFLEDDFSQFDSTQGQGCHEAETWFYEQFPGHASAKKCVSFQDKTVGYGNYYKYSCAYTRKSGDQNTSIGNTFINFLSHAYAIMRYETDFKVKVRFHMMGLGDDNVLAVDVPKDKLKAFGDHVAATIAAMGLKPKLKVANRGTSYCSSEFVPVLRRGVPTYVLVPNVTRLMSKLGFTTGHLQAKDNDMRMKGNMLGNRYLQYMPVLRVFYHFYTQKKGKGAGEYKFNCHELSGKTDCEITEDTFNWFSDLYGLNKGEIDELEEFIMGMLVASKSKPCLYDHVMIAHMLDYREKVVDLP